MKVLKNFKKTGKFIDEFPYVKVKNDEDIYAELPICLAEFGVEYQNPLVYVGPDSAAPVLMEEEELLERIKGTKLFYLKVDEEGKIEEVKKEESNLAYRLPIDTPVEKLAIIQGQLGLLDDNQEPNEVK